MGSNPETKGVFLNPMRDGNRHDFDDSVPDVPVFLNPMRDGNSPFQTLPPTGMTFFSIL